MNKTKRKISSTVLSATQDNQEDDGPLKPVLSSPSAPLFSVIMILCGAILGPFLDSYHSIFGVLQYDYPISLQLWSSSTDYPALVTAWWVPELFGLAGFIIGWLYILLDHYFINQNKDDATSTSTFTSKSLPSPPLILLGISIFTAQYWLSGILFQAGVDRFILLILMTLVAGLGFVRLDNSRAGFITSCATALGGPLIEAGLISSQIGHYHYTDLGETGFFPLWIVPVYFLGGPAVGNLARGVWNALLDDNNNNQDDNKNNDSRWQQQQQQQQIRKDKHPSSMADGESARGFWKKQHDKNNNDSDYYESKLSAECNVCQDSRCVPCPNCDNSSGLYVAYGRQVRCNCCVGRGYVICRSCFDFYGDDPYDLEAIRQIMNAESILE